MSASMIVALTALTAPFLVGPFVVYYAYRVSAHPDHAPAELDHPLVPGPFVEHVEATQRALYGEGFSLAGCAWTTAAWPRTRFVAVFENPLAGTMALASLRQDEARRPRVVSMALRFVTELASGARVVTDNDVAVEGCPGRELTRLAVTGVRSPRRLLQIHLARIAEGTRLAPRSGRVDGEVTTYANSEYVRGLYRQLARGTLLLDEETMQLRPTVRGSIATAWRYLGLGGVLRGVVHHLLALTLLARRVHIMAPEVPATETARARTA